MTDCEKKTAASVSEGKVAIWGFYGLRLYEKVSRGAGPSSYAYWRTERSRRERSAPS